MKIYFAPLEGVTDEIYRRVHFESFGGPDKYFIPFISPTQHFTFSSREQKAMSPEENRGIPTVPQVLTKNAEHFVEMAARLKDFGYTEVNLNAGCPSGTVTAKGKGSGMLRDKPALRQFLDEVFSKCPLPVSVKTRIGYESPEEWDALVEIYKDYPFSEIILHMRTREEFYKGRPHIELAQKAMDAFQSPVVYNGDVFYTEDAEDALSRLPALSGLMLGRGLVANPALARVLKGGKAATREELKAFHDKLLRRYLESWPKNAVIGHMCEIMVYMSCMYESPLKLLKTLRKTKDLPAYEDAAARIFSEMPLRDDPGFDLMVLKK